MAKIGTAHVEIKPVLDEAALAALTERVRTEVARAVALGFTEGQRSRDSSTRRRSGK